MGKVNKNIGDRIKLLRQQKLNLSQKEFANLLEIPQSTVSAYENNRNIPTTEIMIKISQLSNISLDWLCGLKTKPKKRGEQMNYNVKCCYCNKQSEHHERMVKYENDIYCVDCFIQMHEFELTCTKCGYGYEPNEKFIEVDGLHFCEHCVVDEFEYDEEY